MKSKIYLSIVFFVGLMVSAFAQEPPKEGVALVMEETNFKLNPGATAEVEIRLLRSKRAKRTSFDGLQARTSDDLAISFTKSTDTPDTYTMSVLVDKAASPKSHTVVVKGLGTNGSKIKGKVISIEVMGPQIVKGDE